jgi:chromosome segregation ATPase
MASKTPAESIRSLEIELATLRTQLDEFRSAIDRAGPFDLRERFVLLEHRVTELERFWREADRLRERIAVVETQLQELKKREEESSRRLWQGTILFFGSLLTLGIQLIVLFLKK